VANTLVRQAKTVRKTGKPFLRKANLVRRAGGPTVNATSRSGRFRLWRINVVENQHGTPLLVAHLADALNRRLSCVDARHPRRRPPSISPI
jgi:hypothetical protein